MARVCAFVAALFLLHPPLVPGQRGHSRWPQFRGPNGSGVCEECRPPVAFGPGRNQLWKVSVPPGHSSPAVWDDHVFLTAVEGGRLWTIALRARDGRERWRRPAPVETLEKVHAFSSPAVPTPATDGKRVYAYFGSFGLLAYDFAGKEVWRHPLETPPTKYGTASSPIVRGEHVIVQRDGSSTASELRAVDRRTGRTAWTAARPTQNESYSTPMVWVHPSGEDLIAVGSGRVTAYDPTNGRERWSAKGVTFQPAAVAVAGEGLLFASSPGGGGGEVDVPSWSDLIRDHDANGDGALASGEVPETVGVHLRKEVPRDVPGNFVSIRFILGMADKDKDGITTQAEWDRFGAMMAANQSNVLALRPGGEGDTTESHVAWKGLRGIPEMPSPLLYRGRLWFVRDGGMVTSYEPATGRVALSTQRLGVGGQYAASPIGAGGRIYAAGVDGTITVFEAGDTLSVLSRNDLGERILATPAIVRDTLYVRTEKHLWAFR
jgi:outer membrane protein assembly factor BamB